MKLAKCWYNHTKPPIATFIVKTYKAGGNSGTPVCKGCKNRFGKAHDIVPVKVPVHMSLINTGRPTPPKPKCAYYGWHTTGPVPDAQFVIKAQYAEFALCESCYNEVPKFKGDRVRRIP